MYSQTHAYSHICGVALVMDLRKLANRLLLTLILAAIKKIIEWRLQV